MSQGVHIPKLGLTMEEATLLQWHVPSDGRVDKGVVLLTIETDKITFDVEAEASGFLEQVAAVGDRLKIGELVGYLHERAGQRSGAGSSAASAAPAQPSSAAPAIQSAHPAAMTVASTAGGRQLVSPVARRLAQEHGLALSQLIGSGPGGAVLRRDVLAAAAAQAEAPAQALAAPALQSPVATPSVQRRPMSAMRRTISQRMMHSLHSSAQMTGFGRIDMGQVVAWRRALVEREADLGVRITYTDLLLKACACVLRDLPDVNAYIDGDDIVSQADVHIGLAVAIDGGLVVPVLRHVDRLSLVELAQQREQLIARARSGKLMPEEMIGGSFTLSNFGSYGGDFETPILNWPQSALLGIGQISDEAVVREGQVVARPMMMVSLTFDHRLIDGALAGRFRSRLRELLEQPALMLARMR
jgi:pyruvate/2-oxoglutarate dehydrogenase complex dihydrolipoamide acyltransferase (E2) component